MTKYLLPLGSVLIAALALISQRPDVPWVALLLVAAYLVIVAGASLYRPLIWVLSRLTTEIRFTTMVREIRPRLIDTAKRLSRVMERRMTDTIPYVIWEAAQWPEAKAVDPSLLSDPEHLETLREWLSSLIGRLEDSRSDAFLELGKEFSLIVSQYNRYCLQRHRHFQELLASGKLSDDRSRWLKQQWNVRREGHAEVIRDWVNVASQMNERVGERLYGDYHEILATLE